LDKSAANPDILSRKWLLVDVDAIRLADTNSTDAEKEVAGDLAWECYGYLTDLGWCQPVVVDSGNGWHLLYPIDLPNDKLSHAIQKKALAALASRFDRPGAQIDRSVHNASRISKLPGSWVRKGPESDDRPWRMARIMLEPAVRGVVTVEQLQALGVPAPVVSPFVMKAVNGHDDLTNYVRSVIEKECARVILASPGNRNNALNHAAFNVATMTTTFPELDEVTARAALYAASQQAGLGSAESLTTIASGWDSGRVAIPKPRPAAKGTNGTHTGPVIGPAKLTVKLRDVRPGKVGWFYENRIAPGFITIFAGRTGLGKSFVTCDIVAKLSQGCSPPYSTIVQPPMQTLFISEDSIELVLAPRLIDLGANPDMIDFMHWDSLGQYTLADTDMLERAYVECGRPRLVVIDPPSNFLGGLDEHKNAEVRGVLKLLCLWLDKHKVACIFITHINKLIGKGLDSVERIIGSVAWGSSARMTLAFVKDPDVPDQYIFGGTKNNLGPLAETLAYKIVKTDSGVMIQWVGPTDTTVENAMNQIKKKSKGANAVEWLTSQFEKQIEWESTELKKNAKENGISNYALFESPEVLALPIVKRKRTNANGESYWIWIAVDGWPIRKSESQKVEHLNHDQDTGCNLPDGNGEIGKSEY
jgi:hypothetical protein